MPSISRIMTGALAVLLASTTHLTTPAQAEDRQVENVLLLSIDGFHAIDLARFVSANPSSAIAELSRRGVTFDHAIGSKPSDSFPGLLALVTGGSPRSTGVYYDVSYDRALSPPGSACATVGTVVDYSEAADFDLTAVDGGASQHNGKAIDPSALPLDPSKGCTPVYPHSFLRVNTIFEVIKQAGGRTAWADKHPSYELVNGPSGNGVDDLYTPEIASVPVQVAPTEGNDDLKVGAVVNWINGLDHTGQFRTGTPTIFGMNFQAVSVGEKDINGGYADAAGTPSPLLAGALAHTDDSIRKMINALKSRGLFDKTMIVLTAKHGQSPIDRSHFQKVNPDLIQNLIEAQLGTGAVANVTADDVALVWLQRNLQGQTTQAAAALLNQPQAQIGELFYGPSLKLLFDDPTKDSRTPDLIAVSNVGVIYTNSTKKAAEHGGFAADDVSVALLVSGAGLPTQTLSVPVSTMQVAPTILRALHIDPSKLQAVQAEGAQPLPLPQADGEG